MTNKTFEIIERSPTVAEHKFLWESVGWGHVDIVMTEQSLANSVYAVVALCDGDIVGMGRIVGDGAMYFYIQDVAVRPEYQGNGLGKMIMDQLLAFINRRRHKNGIAFIGLFAASGKERFYEQYGFKDHSPEMTGMFTVLDN